MYRLRIKDKFGRGYGYSGVIYNSIDDAHAGKAELERITKTGTQVTIEQYEREDMFCS